jgi:alpha-aminoadipic semialdehyde synthase
MSKEKRIGIRREDKNEWEKRTPLTPRQTRLLLENHGIRTWIQPSSIRCFSDEEYITAGARIEEDLSSCPVVFGVKEMPVSFFRKNQAYAFFSHTIKGQDYNMPMLQKMMNLKCHLMDYEKIENDRGRRLLFFGRYAGLAGMMDTLWALGARLENRGEKNPFSKLKQTFHYSDLASLKEAVSAAGDEILRQGLPDSFSPLVIGIAGYGHVSCGAQEVLDLLPVQQIEPDALPRIHANPANPIYKVIFHEQDIVKPVDESGTFHLQEYYEHPERYHSVFSGHLPYLNVLVNAIYWTPRYPRLVTKEDLKTLWDTSSHPLLEIIGDITCDVEGAIECTLHTTRPDKPTFVYNPLTGAAADGLNGTGIPVMAIDNLPCELPIESSTDFGNVLMKYVPEIVAADFSSSFDSCQLPPPVKRGVILYSGCLTPSFNYLQKYL